MTTNDSLVDCWTYDATAAILPPFYTRITGQHDDASSVYDGLLTQLSIEPRSSSSDITALSRDGGVATLSHDRDVAALSRGNTRLDAYWPATLNELEKRTPSSDRLLSLIWYCARTKIVVLI